MKLPVLAAVLFWASSALAVDPYCEGPGCPVRFEVAGFDVWVSPNIYDAIDFSHERLGLTLDALRAQLLYIDPPNPRNGIPDRAMTALRETATFYFGDINSLGDDPWYPCGTSGWGCIGGGSRIGISTQSYHRIFTWLNFALHELAHAYHGQIIEDGYDNQCIIDAYERGRHRWVNTLQGHLWGRQPHEGSDYIANAYGGRNKAEWFAVSAVAYWHDNGAYPFNRHDLWELDPDAYNIQRAFWDDPDAACPDWALDE